MGFTVHIFNSNEPEWVHVAVSWSYLYGYLCNHFMTCYLNITIFMVVSLSKSLFQQIQVMISQIFRQTFLHNIYMQHFILKV